MFFIEKSLDIRYFFCRASLLWRRTPINTLHTLPPYYQFIQ